MLLQWLLDIITEKFIIRPAMNVIPNVMFNVMDALAVYHVKGCNIIVHVIVVVIYLLPPLLPLVKFIFDKLKKICYNFIIKLKNIFFLED
jgi:hypothetical protein